MEVWALEAYVFRRTSFPGAVCHVDASSDDCDRGRRALKIYEAISSKAHASVHRGACPESFNVPHPRAPVAGALDVALIGRTEEESPPGSSLLNPFLEEVFK